MASSSSSQADTKPESAEAHPPTPTMPAGKSNRKRLQMADGVDVDAEPDSQMVTAGSRSSKVDRKRGADVETADVLPCKRRSSSASVVAAVENEPGDDGDRQPEKSAVASPAAVQSAASAGDDMAQPNAVDDDGAAVMQQQDLESTATGAVSPAKSSPTFLCIDCGLPCRSYTEYHYHRSTSHCRWKPASSCASSAASDDRESIASDGPLPSTSSLVALIKDGRSGNSSSVQAAATESISAIEQAPSSLPAAPAASQASSSAAEAAGDTGSPQQATSGVPDAEKPAVGDRQSSATREISKREVRLSTMQASAASSSSASVVSRRRRSTDQRRDHSPAATQGQRLAPATGGSSRGHRASIK